MRRSTHVLRVKTAIWMGPGSGSREHNDGADPRSIDDINIGPPRALINAEPGARLAPIDE